MPEYELSTLLPPLSLWLAVAESCTGGLIAHRITNVPGSSVYFDRGLVTYSNQAKEELLEISPELIQGYGAVSSEVAVAMVDGLLSRTKAKLAVASTGIAGPGGGSAEKPVGLVYLAGAYNQKRVVERYQYAGDRLQIKEQAAQHALELLIRLIGADEEEV
jgi:PncC family amidohydrolase